MDDDIQLPPLPLAIEPMHTKAAMRDYARAAVLADRERRAMVDARPAVHSMTFSVVRDGSWSCYPPSIHNESATVTINWTDDGRAWIDSERNRELATELRRGSYTHSDLDRAADALDGGVR